MIFDAHAHIWEHWPYQPPVPDGDMRARAEQLLFQMDAAGVERALLICARIGENARNVDYAFECAERYPGQLVVFPDLECRWAPDYRAPGAAGRLDLALSRWNFAGFTLYLEESEDGAWLTGDEGRAFFGLAVERGLVVSLSMVPHQLPAVIALATLFPRLQIMLHHLGFMGRGGDAGKDADQLVLAAGTCPNLHLKYSGMGNSAPPDHEFPYPDLRANWARVARAFGAHRVIWGSDYPVSSRHMTYRQTVSMLERHGPFGRDDLPAIFHDNMARLLSLSTTGTRS